LTGVDIAVVSHLPLRRSGGGMYAVTREVTQQLRRNFHDVVFLEIAIPTDYPRMLFSRLNRRLLHRPGTFFPFSAHVLSQVAQRVTACLPAACQQVLFRSATRWIRCRPAQPYFVHLDAPFSVYCRNKQAEDQFLRSDLQRIQDEEAEFLERAAGVFFESDWGREHALQDYRLRGQHYHTVGVAGGLDRPVAITHFNPLLPVRLLSIAKHFRQKGGDLTGAAFRQLRPRFPDLTWHVIGGPPDTEFPGCPGAVYEGQLNPDLAPDIRRYQKLLNGNAIVVHPTREDINPLVLIEAAQHGAPVISVRDFAIPELVRDGETGLLLPRPVTPEAIAEAIQSLLQAPARMQSMSQRAVDFAEQRFSWERIGDTMARVIRTAGKASFSKSPC
jgi:glycosyltransferase involved in cell wall biosynthesis